MKQFLDEFEYLKRNNLFNPETVNIFCDASLRKFKRVCSYGVIVVYNNTVIYRDIREQQVTDETINSLELKGLRRAVGLAFSAQYLVSNALQQYVPISYINIFSDSKYSVSMVKDYLFKPERWKWDYKRHVYVKPIRGRQPAIPNQDLIIEIANDILKFQAFYPTILLDMWWCPAHIDTRKNKEIKTAGYRFKTNNCSNRRAANMTVDDDFVRYICDSNSKIDFEVQSASMKKRKYTKDVVEPIRFDFGPRRDYLQWME